MKKLRTLVVDDELGIRLAVKKALSQFAFQTEGIEGEIGFDIDLAESGEEAIQKIESDPPDILLLDYKLPGMSGLDVLERMKKPEGGTFTILITAYASIDTAVAAIKQGAFDFLAKPFTPQELLTVTQKAAQSLLLVRQVKQLAEERRQVRFQFIAVLGHELKSPLNAIEGYLTLMKERTLGDGLQNYDQAVDRSLTRIQFMRKLIADMLDLTRIESGQKKRDMQLKDIREIADRAVESVMPEAGSKKVQLHLNTPRPLTMRCDGEEIEIILNNLISNAVKYNREDGHVHIDMVPEGNRIKISVRDTGIGMAPEDLAGLFSEFHRIKNQQTKHILGSGLGLAIVKKVATLYGGDVSVTSEPDVGSTFTVILDTGL